MTPSQPETPAPDLAAVWATIQRLYPMYAELAREFVVDLPGCAAELESGTDCPSAEAVEQGQVWLQQMDELIQVHQLRQFLQTSSTVDPVSIAALLQHLLANPVHNDAMRDKIDFLLVQYFSQIAPDNLNDDGANLAYVAKAMEPVLGKVELKAPAWLNSLDRVLETARKCRSLNELLHGGVLEQGRKAKGQAGSLFFMPVALVAFTRFGYLMRRAFFRLMLAELNGILDGLTELEAKGIETIDCRRAQFSAQEPVVRLRMICQSWKVMFQAEYSSGQPLRMLVDLRASVETALGRKTGGTAQSRVAAKTAGTTAARKPAAAASAAAAASPANGSALRKPATAKAGTAPVKIDTPEFDISSVPDWSADSNIEK